MAVFRRMAGFKLFITSCPSFPLRNPRLTSNDQFCCYEYDQIIIAGPVFPHEAIGFSGGNKYLFPEVSGPEILNFFHWLGALVTNPMIIGNKYTPVRAVVDRAAATRSD
jgi:nickel-dependent lactate racemase